MVRRIVLLTAVALLMGAVVASAGALRVDGGAFQVFTIPVHIEVPSDSGPSPSGWGAPNDVEEAATDATEGSDACPLDLDRPTGDPCRADDEPGAVPEAAD